MTMNGQTFASLWKQVSEAVDNDLPKTEQELLRQIAQKAEEEGDYAQLLKAELQEARSLCSVSPDSLPGAVERLAERERQAKDSVLRAVYDAVLGYVYTHNNQLDEDYHMQIGTDYYTRALAHPDMLAATKTSDYETIIKKGSDSKFFDDDLLSVIGYEAKRFDILSDYYQKSGNRRAALLSALQLLRQQRPTEMERLNKSEYLHKVDSLIEQYADMPEAGEAAIERYNYMQSQTDATAAQKMKYLNEAITRWGSWQRMNTLRNAQRELTALQFVAELPAKVIIPGQKQDMKLYGLRGVNMLTMNIYRVDTDASVGYNPERSDDYAKLKKMMTLLPELTQTRTYIGKAEYEVYEDSMQVPALPVGVYMVELGSSPSTHVARRMLYVSDIRVIAQPMPGRKVRFVVVNATSGQPVAKARIEITSHTGYYSDIKVFSQTTDANGEYIYTQREKETSYSVYVKTGSDACFPRVLANGSYYFPNLKEGKDHTAKVYTDRQLYRPGQTVHAAAIFYSLEHGYKGEVDAGMKTSIVLRDANGQEVAKKEVTTDDYGTCHADLTIPTKGLTGEFTVMAGIHSTRITVEEYKRPAFEVDMPQVKMSYEDGDTVEVKGTARSYAGAPVPGAKVKYKVVRKRAFWWMSYSRYWSQAWLGEGSDDVEMAQGETTTDARGTFAVDVPIVVPKTKYPMFYNFVITADVTDQAGETHQGTLSLPMGNKPKAFSCDMPEKVLNDKKTVFSFHQQNAAGVELDATVRYRFDNSGEWLQAATNKLLDMPKMKSGRHTLQAICEEDTVDRKFTVFALDDKRPAEETDDWFYVSDTQFPYDGTPVTLQIGSSDKDVHMVYAIYAKNEVVESGTVNLDGELLNRKLTYAESYGNGLLLSFAWVKNGVVHTHNTTIHRPMPDMNLKLVWQTFRNRLQPGQEEEWTLTVTAPDGKPADAQLMATLYDKSLDQIMPHEWSLSPTQWLWTPNTSWIYGSTESVHFEGFAHQGWLNVRGLDFSIFNHELYPERWVFRRSFKTALRSRMAGSAKNAEMMDEVVMEEAMEMPMAKTVAKPMAMTKDAMATADTAEAEEEDAQPTTAQVRENLSETAFFYPQLATDSTGRVAIKFTLPESLTTWRFMAVAHTRNMMHGTLFDEAVASKEVMVQPNMPRFVRQGDRATIAARVINLGDNNISGTARLVLLDAETEKTVAQAAQPVSIAADTTIAVTFTVVPREKWPSLLIARVTIEAKATAHASLHFSDGEQHYLPVLPSRDHVTVTVPFTQHKPGTKTIDLKQLIPEDATQAKLTIEYTNNPAWLMVQALPSIGHPDDDCALCQAASLYANAIGMNIIGQNPQAKDIFGQWAKEEEQEPQRTLNSQLQKNEELKDLILGETPWVLDADRETEQRQRLADFFDTDMMDKRLATAFDKVKKLQNPDGSWSWWPDMKGSWYMTVNISQMLVRLNTIVGQPKDGGTVAGASASDNRKLLDKAFKFMGKEAIEQVEWMKRMEREHGIKPTFPSHTMLEWLYICSLDGRQLPAKVQTANDYLIQLLRKETKNQSIYDKAMTAIVFSTCKESALTSAAKTYVKSLKEYTVYREDMGRYYDTDRALYSWRDYRIPTQVAAIEAMQRLTPGDTQTIEEMQRWLLQEKRTQAWDTPVNSTEAVFAFLNGRSQLLTTDAPLSTLAVDGQPLAATADDGPAVGTTQPTAGIGYVKAAMPAGGKSTFTAEKTSKGTSWGAVYAQFLQPTATIADQQSGIKVTREMSKTNFKVGDRITVRIIIEADRDYDFVQVVDKRAACMEPVKQTSGYVWPRNSYGGGFYCSPRDCSTNYYFDCLSKGKHVIETEYFIDRAGTYETGTCTAGCAYSPEFRGMTGSTTITVEE